MIHIDTDKAVKDLKKQFSRLDEKSIARAQAWAINRTLGNAMTSITKAIGKEYNIKAKDIKKAMVKVNAKPSTPWGLIKVSGRTLPLIAFKPRQTKKGVSVQILKGKRAVIPGAFITTMSTGHTGVYAKGKYKRKGGSFQFRKKRINKAPRTTRSGIVAYPDLNITELQSVSIPQAFANDVIQKVVAKELAEKYPQHLISRLNRVLDGLNGA
jgi:hypothetical protein